MGSIGGGVAKWKVGGILGKVSVEVVTAVTLVASVRVAAPAPEF